ncbi:replicative DNA helicase [Candidatus Epulonipiscium fishelsonii]|uniref:Replicative DNA helicase n=1 Tax=Candidatus Epulonipiscium fishelsonii TaxID=77094 RepID=A0ACC8XCX0_9FIRM|nr:replicative DNA helicase [Epulopiscium sp. SCG-B11WGA-EpuloA1]ONI43220.1 replicative DNA helicase [Epulopiscium sp. SCG-B05WGA-EpuloA1]ONI47881.1 replicative DNA helicase [Epulopiscium sp. SCG-C06WGA-EpuloA1]
MRVPPHSIEAEQSVLGSMIMDYDAIIIASETLSESDFYRPDHQKIYNAIIDLHANNKPVDLVTIQDKLKELGVLEKAGGHSYLGELGMNVPTSAHIKQYAQIVKDKSNLRKIIKASQNIVAKGYEAQDSVNDILEFAEQQIFDISQARKTNEFSHINQIIIDSIKKLEEAHFSKGGVTGISTGFNDLDYKIAGMQPSDLILVAARPSMGKTAFALNIIQNAAIVHKKKVAVFSLEMAKDQLVNRMICSEAMVDSQKVRTGGLEQNDWAKIATVIPTITAADIFIDDTAGISVMEMRAKCRRLKIEKGLDLIMIDYLQLMSGHSKAESRQQEISAISRALKSLAREMNVPVIALSQLSRACETRSDHRPMLSDLRESGAIEQDADLVMFLYRDEYYHPETEKKRIGEVIIAKQRNGPTGTVELTWLSEHTKFVSADYYSTTAKN